MSENKRIYEYNFNNRKLVVEIGELAKQANGSVLVRYGDTVILSVCVMSKQESNLDFFPLTVDFQEKLYSVGKIPGGFIKREGKPTENATLCSRLLDRPIRPLFDENIRNEIQITNMVLSVDQDNSLESASMIGTSLALCTSDIPFNTPVALVIVGRIDGEFIINPTALQSEKTDMLITVAGTYDFINMVEASCQEVSEDIVLDAIMFGHEAIKQLIEFQNEIINELNIVKKEITIKTIDSTLYEEIRALCYDKLREVILIIDKQQRNDGIEELKASTLDYISKKYEESDLLKDIMKDASKIFDILEKEEVRRLITEEKIRPDNRKITEIRPLSSSVDILPRTHGSALFTRGQTQALSVTTLGALGEHQIIDGLTLEDEKRFMLHYNFPKFSVGQTGRYGIPSRREVGHGALGEKALLQVIPSEEEFPYTIRVVSEILESNGSTSQASICAACMSLMAAGVPIKNMVAGIAMGLVTQNETFEDYTILTDIQGMEDHLGDMDFKVAGTKFGICALQMDIKIKGITKDILYNALEQAKIGRLEILKHMETTIDSPRTMLSKYAPKIKQITINPEKIKDVIGRGGENITRIILEASNVKSVNDAKAVKIDLDDDGRVVVYHSDYDVIDRTIKMILETIREVEEGKIYTGVVTRVEDFGCFVELWPFCEGLVHVSQLDEKHVLKPSDIVSVGDDILVKAIGYDKKGRINLSRKQAIKKDEEKS